MNEAIKRFLIPSYFKFYLTMWLSLIYFIFLSHSIGIVRWWPARYDDSVDIIVIAVLYLIASLIETKGNFYQKITDKIAEKHNPESNRFTFMIKYSIVPMLLNLGLLFLISYADHLNHKFSMPWGMLISSFRSSEAYFCGWITIFLFIAFTFIWSLRLKDKVNLKFFRLGTAALLFMGILFFCILILGARSFKMLGAFFSLAFVGIVLLILLYHPYELAGSIEKRLSSDTAEKPQS